MSCCRVLTYFVTFSTSRHHLRHHLCDHNHCHQLGDRHLHNYFHILTTDFPINIFFLFKTFSTMSTMSMQTIICHRVALRVINGPKSNINLTDKSDFNHHQGQLVEVQIDYPITPRHRQTRFANVIGKSNIFKAHHWSNIGKAYGEYICYWSTQ